MKKFALISSIAGIICIVVGVVVISVTATAGADVAGTLRRGHIRFHDMFDCREFTDWDRAEIHGISVFPDDDFFDWD